MAYAVPLDAPSRRLPFGQVNDLALAQSATALLTGQRGDPAHWKRYRGGTAGRLWVASAEDPLFTRVLSDLNGQLAAPMIVGGRLVFLSDHEGTGNLYSTTLDGSDLQPATPIRHDGFYARNPATDVRLRSCTTCPGTSGAWTAWPPTPVRASWTSSSPAHACGPRAAAVTRRRPPRRARLRTRPARPGVVEVQRHGALADARRRPGPRAVGEPARPRPAAPHPWHDGQGRVDHRRGRQCYQGQGRHPDRGDRTGVSRDRCDHHFR